MKLHEILTTGVVLSGAEIPKRLYKIQRRKNLDAKSKKCKKCGFIYMDVAKCPKCGNTLTEELQYIKFAYKNYKNDKRPKVKVLDYKYKGIPGQKTYGERDDLLGWNLNYIKNKKMAIKAIDDIDSFARALSANKEEKYRRIKYFFPEQAKLIRRYMRDHIKGMKVKDGILWKKADYNSLIKFDKQSY